MVGIEPEVVEEAASKLTKIEHISFNVPSEAIEFFERYGFSYIDAEVATTRWTFITPRGTVLKIPQAPYLTDVNKEEVENWQQFGENGLLAPIVDYDEEAYTWVEMVYCEDVGEVDHYEFINRAEEHGYEVRDQHEGNVGRHPETGELVSVDYASGVSSSE